MDALFIPIVLGTSRDGRSSEHVANFIYAQAQSYGFETRIVDVREFVTNPHTSAALSAEKKQQWHDIALRMDGLMIVSPEYNHGYPGELKLLLDELYDEYHRKPVAVCSVSVGPFGGARMTEQLRLVVTELQMVAMRNAVHVGNVRKLFDEQGTLIDPSLADRVKNMFEELAWYAQALKRARTTA